MSIDPRQSLPCAEFEELAVLYALGELAGHELAAVEAHAAECASCAALLESEAQWNAAIAGRRKPADALDGCGMLLAQCRSELAEAIDDATHTQSGNAQERAGAFASGGWAWLYPSRWATALRQMVAGHPGWSTAALLIVGATASLVGSAVSRQILPEPAAPVMTVSSAPRLSESELQSMDIDNIRWEAQPGTDAPRVQVRFRSGRAVLEGAPDDAELRRVLTYVVEHGQKFDPGIRLDSLDVLRSSAADARVKTVLCEAALHDKNPAVRLKAIEALQGSASDAAVRQAMFGALAQDDNSGVRIEALNALLASLGDDESAIPGDDVRARDILRERMQKDPNNYVRERSAAVLQRLVPGEFAAPDRAGHDGTSSLAAFGEDSHR
jgi:hypothetical protein